MDTKTVFIVLSVLALCMCDRIQGQDAKNDTKSTDMTTSHVVITTELEYNTTNATSQPITTSGLTVTSQTTAKESTSSVIQTTSDLVTSSVTSSVTSDAVGTTSASNSTSTTKAPPCPNGRFDAASFVGGIFLGLVLCVASNLVYRWYQSKNRPGAPYEQL